jgi:predicted Zn-dependent peptidase
MINGPRGAFAAFFLTVVVATSTLSASADPVSLAPGETVLPNGLTSIVRQEHGPGAVAIELWIRCPSDGWSTSQPGIARLAAFAAINTKKNGVALGDLVRADGGDLSVSVFQTATEIAILAPSYAAPDLESALLQTVLHGSIDSAALDLAKSRLAEQQAAARSSSSELLREAVFGSIFAAGPVGVATFGDDSSLKAATLDDVRSFAARAFLPSNAIAVVVGNGDAGLLTARLTSASGNSGAPPPMPQSQTAAAPADPIKLTPPQADFPGVAIGWAGPPITDQRAATAMDFLSDYLADPRSGVLAGAARDANATATFEGQFVTLQNAGLFYATVTGDDVNPAGMSSALRSALQPVLSRTLSRDDFARALGAYETRLLRQMDSPQGIADNYGWYFVEGAPSYTPSATGADLGGTYFESAASLTPDFVRGVAQRYLGAVPTIVFITPSRPPVSVSPGGN